jgi:hypothetical protein
MSAALASVGNAYLATGGQELLKEIPESHRQLRLVGFGTPTVLDPCFSGVVGISSSSFGLHALPPLWAVSGAASAPQGPDQVNVSLSSSIIVSVIAT